MTTDIATELGAMPVPRNNAEAFRMCRDYQQRMGYHALTKAEVETILGRPCAPFIKACGHNVTSSVSGGEIVYSFKYKMY